ncbi:MAG: riboflavin synthase [Acidobacteriota bacterium]
MFTGLVKEVGTIRTLTRRGREGIIEVDCASVLEGARRGDSVAVDGACLTVEKLDRGGFSAFLSAETLSKTTLGGAAPGTRVNLEPALAAGDRLGGHMVQGHVDGVASVVSLERVGEGWNLAVDVPGDLVPFVIPKGSIALAGVSLTAARVSGTRVEVAVVPATLRETTLGSWSPGLRVNVETDMVGRYVVAYLKGLLPPGKGFTVEDLKARGF